MQNTTIIKFIGLFLLLTISFALSLFYGGSETIALENSTATDFIFWQIRWPKSTTAVLAGSSLAISGLILQILFRNPLAGPYVLGISSGASLLVAISIMAGTTLQLPFSNFFGKSVLALSAMTGSFLVTLLVLAASKKINSNVVLLIIGLMFSQICGAVQSALEYFADPSSVKIVVVWGMGSLGSTSGYDFFIFIPVVSLALLTLLFFIKPLNALLLGQQYAQTSGINFNAARFGLILISSLFTGITTAFCGPIAFVGIAVPVLSRMLFSTSRQQVHVISCALLGSIILLLSDFICHNALKNVSLPINMITSLLGAPLVIYLMFKNKQW